MVNTMVEIAKEIEGVGLLVLPLFRLPLQVINDGFGVDLFLNVKGRSLHYEIGPILLVLAAPDQLRFANF